MLWPGSGCAACCWTLADDTRCRTNCALWTSCCVGRHSCSNTHALFLTQNRIQVFICFIIVLVLAMLIMSFTAVFAGGGLSSVVEPVTLLTLQLTIYNVSTPPATSLQCAHKQSTPHFAYCGTANCGGRLGACHDWTWGCVQRVHQDADWRHRAA